MDNYRALIKIKRADNLAKADPHAIDKKLLQMKNYLSEILENGECYSLKALTVNGNDCTAAVRLESLTLEHIWGDQVVEATFCVSEAPAAPAAAVFV